MLSCDTIIKKTILLYISTARFVFELEIITLTRNVLEQYLDQLLQLEDFFCRQMGSTFTTDIWEADNFLSNLPCKWTLSKLARQKDRLLGYWLVSCRLPSCLQIHRAVTTPMNQKKGVGKRLFEAVLKDSKKNRINIIQTETSVNNKQAIQFYENLGFFKLDTKEVREYLEQKGRDAVVSHNYLEEKDGSRYFVYRFNAGGDE